MTDSTLITLFNQVPMNSIILIDEIEKQLETININKNKSLSYGGILSAMAGAEKLSHSVIIIITVNDIDKLDSDFKKSLIRPGRIDNVVDLKNHSSKLISDNLIYYFFTFIWYQINIEK